MTSDKTVRSADGTEIAYTVTGTGATVIYVGGAIMHRAIHDTGNGAARLLAPEFTVITYDRRGRGESGDAAAYSVEREIDDLDALIQVAGGSAVLFGESSGAVLALEAARRGSAIAALACYEPPFVVAPDATPMPVGFTKRLEDLVAEGRRGEVVELFMTVAVGMPGSAVEEARDTPMWSMLESLAHTIAYDGHIMGATQSGDSASLDRFRTVTAPTLALAGGDSAPSQRIAVEQLASVLPNATTRTIPGQGHHFDPVAVVPAVAAFFTEHERIRTAGSPADPGGAKLIKR
jgi:pimeloyl-ACP methyl ester carboxylesterase